MLQTSPAVGDLLVAVVGHAGGELPGWRADTVAMVATAESLVPSARR